MKYSKGDVYTPTIKMAKRGTYSSERRQAACRPNAAPSFPYLEFSQRVEEALAATAPAFPALRRSIIKERKLKMIPEQPERWDILP